MPRVATAAAAQPKQPQGPEVSAGHLEPTPKIRSHLEDSAGEGRFHGGSAQRGFEAPFWDRPPSPAGGRNPPEPQHAAQRNKYLSNTTTSPAVPPPPPSASRAGAPHTRRATCGATAVPRGTSPPRNDFTGSLGQRRGVRPDQPTPHEGRPREGSGEPAPILLGAREEGGRSPAALGEPSQTSAPASGLRRAQVAARKPEPGQPERQRVPAREHPSQGDVAGSPQPCRRGPQALQRPAASSTIAVAWDGAWGVL